MTSISSPDTVGYDIETLRREQFPITRDTVYFNHAGVSPLPQRTFDALTEANRRLMLDPSGSYDFWFDGKKAAFAEAVRALINARRVEEIIGITSTSLGLNLVAQSLSWQPGQNAVLCDAEFPTNVYPWMRLREQYGIELRLVPRESGGMTVESLPPFVDSNTRLVTVSAVQFFTGQRADLNALGAFCHERGILFAVDAIQAAGHIPLDVQAAHIDILATGGQKSLMGPPGQGFLYVRDEIVRQTYPTFVGPDAVVDHEHWLKYDLTLKDGAARFGLGTTNFSGIVGLLESVTMLRELGLAAIDRHTTGLIDYAIDQLRGIGCEVITPAAHGPIVTFRAASTDAATTELHTSLKARRIFIAKHWDAQDIVHLRVSVHCYNTTEDIDHLIAALKELIHHD